MTHVPPEGGDVDGVALDELRIAPARYGNADLVTAEPLGLQAPSRRPPHVVLRQPQTIAGDPRARDLRFPLFVNDRDHADTVACDSKKHRACCLTSSKRS